MPEFNKDEVRRFLKRYKRIAAERGIYVVDRDKTDQTLIKLGFTRRNCRDEILSLSVLDYCSGPDPDFSRQGYLWIFGKIINSMEIYIKLKIVQGEHTDSAISLSFHAADEPLSYPFREDM